MTAASLLIPKISAKYLYDTYPLELALKELRKTGYTAVPVISKDGRYISTVSEGDFLWYLFENEGVSLKETRVKDIICKEKNPPAPITSTTDELFEAALVQNFIPIIDDRGFFMGIVTRQNILRGI